MILFILSIVALIVALFFDDYTILELVPENLVNMTPNPDETPKQAYFNMND